MSWKRKGLCWLMGLMSAVLVGGTAFVSFQLWASLPILEGEHLLPGLLRPVTVTSDRYGIPTLTAHTRLDAIRALGYVTARDRLFQMDLLRRYSAGRLAEVFGPAALPTDIEQRSLGFKPVATAITAALPNDQRQALQAYAQGVNAFLARMGTPPFEFLLLGYRPHAWTADDSMLVVLHMFQTLSGDETAERMLTIMETVLPPAVVAFLTPDTDAYTTVLTGGPDSHRPIQPIPVQALAALRRAPVPTPQQSGRRLPLYDVLAGSNAWAVNHAKTVDGRAILANDMHLQFSVPNIWYRVALRYGKTDIAGVLLPGVPLIVAGSNGHVAWGMTNSNSDVLDLIRLEINPANPEEYRTPGGWKRFEVVSEVIQVKGSKPQLTEVKHTIWGPVRPQPLLGAPVALRWTALQPQAVDIGLLHMDQATTLPEAIEISSRLRGPPLHVLIADQQGRIAWTSSGRIPVRQGFDGSVSLSWAHGGVGWQAYIPPEMLPRIIDPAPGFLVTANNRLLGKAYPYVLGHNFAHSYRAYHISQRLRAMDRLTEQDMFRLQLDTTSHFYDFYHQLALAVLPETAPDAPPLFAALRQHLRAWDGQATVESVGFALLVRFRALLLTDVFAPFLGQCQEADAEFSYVWRNQETPLRMLLTARSPDLLPVPEQYATWEAFIRGKLLDSLQQLQNEYRVSSPEQLTWGRINTAYIVHPLAEALPVLGRLLNMPQEALPGCTYCIRTTRADWGASKRLVVSPGHLTQGILHMPGGQSGHPLSPHYRDQHRFWVQGKPLPFLPGLPIHTLILRPATQQMPPDRGQP